ncbi:MAG: DUF2341 domain-containing protein [Candidatus Pacebacteria bacterium]|nr:DUF2341 domain-containing protein [Candidatus Paceibacterota bacterium]
MSPRTAKIPWKFITVTAVVLGILGYTLWATSSFVMAYREVKRAHIFPTVVTAEGWHAPEKALTQDLSEDAVRASFTEDIAAYVRADAQVPSEAPVIHGESSEALPETTSIDVPVDDVVESTTHNDADVEASPAQETSTNVIDGGANEEAGTADAVPEDTAAEEVVVPQEAESTESVVPDAAPEVVPAVISEPTSMNDGSTLPLAFAVREGAFSLLSLLTTPVFATTTDGVELEDVTSTTTPKQDAAVEVVTVTENEPTNAATPSHSQAPDISTCVIDGTPCHTIEFSGFGVYGDLAEKPFVGAELVFSFAGDEPVFEGAEDNVVARYFVDGRWKEAGGIFLNKELSNHTNNGFFSVALDEIDTWEDFQGARVMLEYVRADGSGSQQLFLDALWIDALYKERAQDVIDGEGPAHPEVSDNVQFDLSESDADETMLVLDDGSAISFPLVDDIDEDVLTMRTDASSAKVLPGDGASVEKQFFVSVTNTGREEEYFELSAAFPQGSGELKSIAQFLRNVPEVVEHSVYEDVTFFCEGGWTEAVDEEGRHRCVATGQVEQCAWFNDTKENCTVAHVLVGTEKQTAYQSTWVPLAIGVPGIDWALFSPLPEGFVTTSVVAERILVLPEQTVYFRVTTALPNGGENPLILQASGERYYGDIDMRFLRNERDWLAQEEAAERDVAAKKVNRKLSEKSQFEGNEQPQFRFKFNSQRSFAARFADRLLGKKDTFAVRQARLKHTDGQFETVPVDIIYDSSGEWTLTLTKKPRGFRPGKYQMEVVIVEGRNTFTDTVEFYWGVLAINSHKSVYEPGENAALMMAALDDTGDTLCDAHLQLLVQAPEGPEQEVPIRTSGLCGHNNVVDVADYLADYVTGGIGTYAMTLTHFGEAGEVLHRINDAFEVRNDPSFVVERSGPTRIYPKEPYRMTLSITARRDFEGVITEAIPEDTILVDKADGSVEQYNGAIRLSWDVALAAGETKVISYVFDSPDISPYLYVFGPLTMKEGDAVAFEELRTWKVASDALGSYQEKYSSWTPTVAGAWQEKNLASAPFSVPANAVAEIAVVNGDFNTEVYGGVRHSTSTNDRRFQLHEAEPSGVTMMTMHVQVSATSSIQTYAEDTTNISFVLLGYWTDGRYVESFTQIDPTLTNNTWGIINLSSYGVSHGNVVEMALGNWDTVAEMNAGVRAASSSLSRLANIHESEANGVNGVTMMVRASSTNATIEGFAQVKGANGASVDFWLMGYWQTSPTGLLYTERFDDLGGPTSASTWTDRALDGFTVPPTGIAEVLYANAADANSSMIIGARTNASTLGRSFNIHEAETGGWSIGKAHVKAGSDASSTIEYFTDDTTNDQFRLLGYWAAANYPTDAPTLYGEPFESQKTGSSTPSFRFSASDPDGTSSILYQIQWDDDPTLDDAPIGDRSSDVETGCSPNCFQNIATPADTSPFNEGEQIRFTIPTSLVSGTTYYWRVRATDVSGSNLASEWSTVQSFTYVANTDPSQWFQTQDTQFETGTLSSVETSGNNAAELSLTPPDDALVAYGEGTVTTPRYRLWDGTAWGSEGSALDVGGIIQYVVTKAGTTRDEFVLATQDAVNDVNVQIFSATTTTWRNLQEVTAGVANNQRRGFDVAYETLSGDALVVFCDGDADPAYYVWNGSVWTGPTSINIGSALNCEYIKLASDPVSDEIILVERNTGSIYEAQVWDGSGWSFSQTLGSMSDAAHEGIAVEYEESGEQAMVVVSNAGNANFAWATWDGALLDWSIPTTQAIGNDFEWGILRQDDGSDQLGLCYGDQDDDMGSLIWDGAGWAVFAAATNEFETTGTTNNRAGSGTIEGTPVTCEFETTAGRDGYLMIPYSDNTAARSQYWNGTAHSGESTLPTIQDSWRVTSARAGDGDILALYHDDLNGLFDFSYWDGTSWSAAQTLENSPSVTAAPFREPISIAAKVYQSNSGTIQSDPIAFSSVPNRTTWGEALWSTNEPSGTDVTVQVMYESGGVCSSLLPDGVLTGNSTGFQASASPIDLSSVSTTTYSSLCLKATLTSSNTYVPSLTDWTLSWERSPYLTQEHYRWYVNTNAATPSDVWPSGASEVVTDAAIQIADGAPSLNDVLRLRMTILVSNVALSSSALSLTLQYAADANCSAGSEWFEVGEIGSTTAPWRGYNNAGVSDGATLPSVLLTTADVAATYEEENDSATNPNSISTTQEGEWDWVLQHNATEGTNYCFRVITSEGETLNAYSTYPALVTNAKPTAPSLMKLFDNEKTASTTPWFEFTAEDPESNDMTYQVQIDDTYDFSSAVVDRDSQTNFTEFSNVTTPADKDPFTAGQTIRFIPTTALSNGTTYYWRVRAKDRNNSNTWSSWSTIYSLTVDTSITVATWHQTRLEQFDTNSFEDTEATSTHDVVLTPPLTLGTTTSSAIDFDNGSSGNAWGSLSWTDNETTGDIRYHIEYLDSSAAWVTVPDTDLSGNHAGFGSGSPVSLLSLSPTTYNQIRVRANLTSIGGSPRLNDWTVSWGYAVGQATSTAPFDNEKVGTTTPTFRFGSDDPQNDSLIYEVSISTTQDFTASTTRRSDLHSGFTNTASSTDTSPFKDNNSIAFHLQQADALTNGVTYWWRVRAIDPAPGAGVWSVWSDLQSFTIDTSVTVSTWFQTTDDQFETDTLSSVETYGSNIARISTTIREAFMAYAEGTTQAPRYRIWTGTAWGSELSGVSTGDTIRFVEAAASPTRDEYIVGTLGSTGVVKTQVYNGTTDSFGNIKEVESTVANALARGFDVAYETSSGDAMVVSCRGTEAVFSVWNGTSWTATSSIALGTTGNCEWVRLAADPASDEMVLVVRSAIAGATDYEAQIWNGTAWGVSPMTMGSQLVANAEGMFVEYEESGGQAVVGVANGANNNFIWNAWNGSGWDGTNTAGVQNDFANGRLVRDVGSDRMGLCYIDIDSDLGFLEWSGSGWNTFAEFEGTGNTTNGFHARPVSCEFETTAGRDGYLMMMHSDSLIVEYEYWTGSGSATTPAQISTLGDSWEVRSARTGDGNILALTYNDGDTQYDFSYWNGTQWSTAQIIETNSIPTLTPATIPLDIVARRYPTFNSGTITSSELDFDSGTGPKWQRLLFSDSTPGASDILYQIEYFTSTSSWAVIPNVDLAGNMTGTSTSPLDISNLNRITYNQIRLVANLACAAGICPSLNDWTIEWSDGITLSGTAKQYDETTNVTSGTVAVAVNGVLQAGKTGTISAGAWSIPSVTAFAGDVITVFVDGAADNSEAVALTVYDGTGDITGMQLFEQHVSLGSQDVPTMTNANISQYDNSISGDEDIFFEVDAGNDFAACGLAECTQVKLYVASSTTFRPDSTSGGNVTTHDLVLNGYFTADGNTITATGSWDNNGTFTKDTSTVILTATSTTETIDGTGATTTTFYNLTFGQTSGAATWNLSSALDVDGALNLTYGTLNQNGNKAINVASNMTISTNGVFTKGTATTTFDGTGSSTFTDNTVAKQDMGIVTVDGSTKTLLLGAASKMTDVTIGADDILSVNNNYALEVLGNFINNNSFVAQSGTVTFTATDTGNTITPGTSSFYNMTFNGVGGNWAFTGSTLTAGNNFTIATGTVTMPTATTTVTGNFDNTGGTFMHNNGILLLNAASAKTIRTNGSSLYDTVFNGTGSWSFLETTATSSRHVTLTAGTVTLPSGTFAIGGSLSKNGGTMTHNSGTLRFTAATAQTIRLNGSDVYNLTFNGTGGSWSFVDTHATATNAIRIEQGALTLPSGVFAVGGSWLSSVGTFTHNSGTVKFNSTDSGESINPGASPFYSMSFDAVGGGWTIASHATSTNNTSITRAASFTLASGQTLEVGGTFTNSMGGATTTWTGSTLFLNSGTAYSVNTKAQSGDTYETLRIGANTDIKLWNSSASGYTVDATGSLYSQDHAAVDGDLYIWGQYTPTGNEFWSYATDFDGTALGGSSRQVDVRLGSGASVFVGSNTLQILGGSAASTTVANQGSGTYALQVGTGATLQAQYYQVRNTDANGLWISGTATVNNLSDGDFELGTNGGTMITVAGTAIDQNPALQIQRGAFATSTGISSGFNVVATGTPTSYWWFRNHSGNYDGEDYDTDPTGNPGNVRWDNSGFSITVSGNVYASEGSGAIGNPPCDGSAVVRIVVDGGSAYTGTCDGGTGAYSIPGVSFAGDAVLTAYLNTNGGKRAVTVTKTPTADITNLDLYENTLIVRHEDTAAITIANLALYDSSNDADIFFTAATGSPDTLTVAPENELHILAGKTFAPGGNITLESGGSGDARDGRLHVGVGSTFTGAGTESHAIGGGLVIESSGTFTPANTTLTLTATTTGKVLSTVSPLTLYNLVLNGVGGGWLLSGTGTTTVQNGLTLTAGTLGGTGDLVVQSGDVAGAGTITMTGGTVRIESTGNFANSNPWQFRNLTLGNGVAARTTTKTGSATTTVAGTLTVAANHTLAAGSSAWVLTGGGTPLVVGGTFTVQTAPFSFVATTTTSVLDETYALLHLAPAAAGSPTFTVQGGTLTAGNLVVGDGTNPVTVTLNTNDPSTNVTGNLTIGSGATLVASNVGALDVGGSWLNTGTFTHSSGSVLFNSTDTGEVVASGGSLFNSVNFNSSSGGWTITENATSSGSFSITNANSFTLNPGITLEVDGTFTNSVGGSATTWTGSNLYLNSASSYSMNTKTAGGDVYNTLLIGANTDVRSWNTSAGTTTVNSTGSLYSQDHAAVDGDLYIWGEYARSTGSDYWSYATDFDGVALGGSSRQVDVRVATSSTLTYSGGLLDIIGDAAASTTIDVQGTGAYAFSVSGGTFNASYYVLRNTNASGLNITGSPTVTSLSNGDFELAVNGGTMLTVAGSVITANPLKIFTRNTFATSTGISSGFNVRATGSTASSWKFNLHYGNYDGESFNDDPAGDPGYIRWDDSSSDITIEGHVYSDEGTSVSSVCDGITPVVRLMVQGAGSYTSSCDGTGLYSITGVFFNPGDTLTVFLDTNGGVRAANVSVDPITNITDMDLYENRVIVRHEDTTPINIADMVIYDADDDSDIPFTATDAVTDTLVLPAEKKLIVWNSKTFAPAGNITVNSGGSGNAWDGSLEVQTGATLTAAGTQSHAVGGSFTLGSGATFASASSTVTLTATTTGKTINPQSSSFYNLVFNGVGGNWSFASGNATTTGDVTVTNGTLTMPSGTLSVAGSFDNSGGTIMHNNGTLYLNAAAIGKNIRTNNSNLYNLTLNGAGGAWSFLDTNATTSNNFTVTAGSTTLPAGIFAVGGSFANTGTFNHHGGMVKFTAAAIGKTIQASGSNFYDLVLNGTGGAWTFLDTNATTSNNFTLTTGSTTLPAGIFAVGGSFANAGTFNHNTGTVAFYANTTGKTVAVGGSLFYGARFNSSSGGWTITENATSSGSFSITNANSFTLNPGITLEVDGTFTNSVGGSATTWTGSNLYLNSASSYSMNTKTAGGDVYNTLLIGANTDVRSWNTSAGTTTVNSTGSLYSQDHAAVDGDLYIWGEYARSTGSDYWSYATDFDGVALGGSSRQVDVRVATSSSVTISGTGGLQAVGVAGASTTIAIYGSTGTYTWAVSGGTLNMNYYQVRNTDANGLNITGSPTVTSLSNGDFELSTDGGTMLTLAGSAIDANASKQVDSVRFATSTGVSTGYNVTRTGSPITAWDFSNHLGNYDGEAFDSDGGDSCGAVRWDDSTCLFVSQEHYRWRNDDGTEGALDSEWYSASWSKRQKIAVTNGTSTAFTNFPVEIQVAYDADMQSDFDDLRFTSDDGTTLLNYWREESSASVSSTVWVELPTLAANGSATIYMYYGNGGVAGADDGTAVFDYFDDFEDDNISEYSGDTTLFDTDTTFNHNYVYGLDAGANSADQTTSGIRRTGSLTAQGKTIRFFQYVDSTQDDEPCTLFGVGGSGSNYAVCLDEYPTDRLVLAKNVTSNDGSGTHIASTTVSYSTGWYEVVVDWHVGNTIVATVYDDTGAEFASTTATDSTHTSGGVGFSFWGQHGGWDFYSVRTYTQVEPTYIFGAEQGSGGATWKAAEDTALSAQSIGENVRLRFSVQNTGAAIFSQNFRLQYAAKGSALNCESVPYVNYNDVPTTSGGCGSSPACMTTTAEYTDQAGTAGLLSYPANLSYSLGKVIEDPSNQTSSTTIAANAATEVEYNFELTANATDPAYCFRTSDGGLDLDNYDRVAEVALLHTPEIAGFNLNNDLSITLTEGATTTVYATGTVTDLNGYADLLFATTTIYRSGVGVTCSADENNCYQVASTSCSFSNCAGNSCTLSCRADLQYFAEATDAPSAYPSENWLARVFIQDSSGERVFDTIAVPVEVLTVFGLAVNTADIDFGSLEVGSNTAGVNEQTTILNTGNSSIDIQVAGTDLAGSEGSIAVGEQKFATSTFTYGACAICQFLTGSATNVEVDLPKTTASTSPSSDDVYWGLNVPTGTKAELHQGTNTFIATSD